MKKLLIIITLFVSSFFLIALKDVKALEIDFNIDLSLINDTFYQLKNSSDEFIKNDSTFSDSYVIFYQNNQYYVSFLPLNYNVNNYYAYYDGSTFYIVAGSGSPRLYKHDLSSNSFISSGSLSSNYIKPYINIQYVYSNFNFIFRKDTTNILKYNYNNWSFSQEKIKLNHFMSLYDLNIEYELNSNSHQEEIDKVTNFYTMVIEKLSYLAEEISNNYILLFTIGIFIITFVFLLIFRRFL